MPERQDPRARHGYHPLTVKAVRQETPDTCSIVLDIPDHLRDDFAYRPGQFCTFRVRSGDDEVARCYSMSSAPEVDDDLTVTVKRVSGGIVSNWLNDHAEAGAVLEVTRPAGTFGVREGDRPVIAFCGGSGVTPIMSIAKSVLASTSRPVHLLVANRDRGSVIFDEALRRLEAEHVDRLVVDHHLDEDAGFVDAARIATVVAGRIDADFAVCGPDPFMALVERTLLDLGVAPDAIAIERFVPGPPDPLLGAGDLGDGGSGGAPRDAEGAGDRQDGDGAGVVPAELVVVLKGKKHRLAYTVGDTILETARRASLATPYSCEAGSCATCMALLRDGTVAMRTNDILEPDEVEEGWVLTCQSVPTSPSLTVEFEPL